MIEQVNPAITSLSTLSENPAGFPVKVDQSAEPELSSPSARSAGTFVTSDQSIEDRSQADRGGLKNQDLLGEYRWV